MSRADPISFPYRRVNVVGTSAVGKTTFASVLAERLNVPHVELDALHWESNWTEAPDEVMRERVAGAVGGESWVVDGNYSVSRDLVCARAQAVIWLDYPLRTILHRYVIRTWSRLRSQEEIWPGTGNRERWRNHLVGREGLLWWILSTYIGVGASIRSSSLSIPSWRWCTCAHRRTPMRGCRTWSPRRPVASTRCRPGSARASRSAAAP